MAAVIWPVSGSPKFIQDLPFDSLALFAEQTDHRLHGLKDSRTTLFSLGLYPPAHARKRFKPQHTQRFTSSARTEPYRRKSRGYRHRQGQPLAVGSHLGSSHAPPKNKQSFEGTTSQPATRIYLTLYILTICYLTSPWDCHNYGPLGPQYSGSGVHPPISVPPSHPPFLSLFRDPSHKHLFAQEVQGLLRLGAVEEVPAEQRERGFYSQYFLIPKAAYAPS